jgi:hypothetical protein
LQKPRLDSLILVAPSGLEPLTHGFSDRKIPHKTNALMLKTVFFAVFQTSEASFSDNFMTVATKP